MTPTRPRPYPVRVPVLLTDDEAGALGDLADVAEGIPGLSRVMTALNKVRFEQLMALRARQAAGEEAAGRDPGPRMARLAHRLPAKGIPVTFTESEAAVLAGFSGTVRDVLRMGRAVRVLEKVGRLLAEARATHAADHARRVARYTGGRTRLPSRSGASAEDASGTPPSEPGQVPGPSR